MTSSPLTTCAPVILPNALSNANSANVATTTTTASKPVVLSANAEIEITSQDSAHAANSEYFSTDAPVDVDEALENNEPASQNWITTEGGQESTINAVDENQGWGNDQGQDDNAWDNANQDQNWGNDNDWANDNAGQETNAQDEWQQPEASDEAYNTVNAGDNDWQQSDDQGFETVHDRQEEKAETQPPAYEPVTQPPAYNDEWQQPQEPVQESDDKIEGEHWETMDENDKDAVNDNDQNKAETEENQAPTAAGEAAAIAVPVEEAKVEIEVVENSEPEVNKNTQESDAANAAAAAVTEIKPKTSISPARRAAVNRKFQSLDLNLNVDGAAGSVSSGSDVSSQYWHNYSFMKHKASWLYGNNWSRKGSDASSFVSSAQELEDLYCDDEISPNLENDPNMMLTAYYRNAPGAANNNDINFPERPCLTDRGT